MKKAFCAAGLFALGAAAGAVYLTAPGKYSKEQAAPFYGRNIAHRGYHSGDSRIPENSIPAFRAAVEAGYGVEYDLHITNDGHVVVYHDDDLIRGCGVNDRIENMSYDQIRALRIFGSDEMIPSFDEVLSIIDGKVPMVVELKSSERNRQLCKAVLARLRSYKGDYCIESFDCNIVTWFRFHAPDILRGQLSSRPHKLLNDMSSFKAFFVGRCLTNFMARPQFIAYGLEKKPPTVRLSELFGAMKVCWTSLSRENEKKNDCVIFQYYSPPSTYK